MSKKGIQVIFPILLTVTLFSLWAGFALLVINKLYQTKLPGYTIGKLCIWEFVALIISALVAFLMIRSWGNIEIEEVDNKPKLILNPRYGIYFLIYFALALIVGIWQFLIFSQNY